MNYAPKYRGLMDSGTRVSKGKIQPYGIYKISTYKYVDTGRTTLRGDGETLIFVTGIYDKKVSALKLSNIEPIKFLNWFKDLAKKGGNDDSDILNSEQVKIGLYELATPMDKGGNKVYDSYIKNKPNFVAKGAAYRTYKISGIQHATEFTLKKPTLKQYYD